MKYRLGIDLGTTSLGWCVLPLANGEPIGIERMGVRIFSDGRSAKDKTPLAVERREARGARRRRDRLLRRKKRLMDALVKYGLMPNDEIERKKLESLDPYQLRTHALDRKLDLYQLGRAIFHLNQRRGFKSNRKTDKADNDGSAMKTGIKKLEEKLGHAGARTLGEFLNNLNADLGQNEQHLKSAIRFAPVFEKNKNNWEVYPDRSMYVHEFDLIFAAQKKFHEKLDQDAIDDIKSIIFFQRELLKPVPGNCIFENGKESGKPEKRAPWAFSSAQKRRYLEQLNSLNITEPNGVARTLTSEERAIILDQMESGKGSQHDLIPFDKLKKSLKLKDGFRFNFETSFRSGLNFNETTKLMGNAKAMGDQWHQLTIFEQDQLIGLLLNENNESAVQAELKNKYKLNDEQIQYILEDVEPKLDDGYGKLSAEATYRILPFLIEGMIYSDACKAAGYHHSDTALDGSSEQLPYYGQILQDAVIDSPKSKNKDELAFGKIGNPTVHIGLNQLRKLVNALIDVYGKPEEIHIELARDLKVGPEEYKKIESENAKNRKKNEEIRDRIKNECPTIDVKNNENIIKWKLWEGLAESDLERRCAFTGKQISVAQLFSDEIEIEHLIPFSRSFDDSMANKTICFREANRIKKNQTPYEAFSSSPNGFDWAEIKKRVLNLPKNKQWRFDADAIKKFQDHGGDMIARQLSDTQYLARISRRYLTAICPENKIVSIPGRLTAKLRGNWRLNLTHVLSDGQEDNVKLRNDHRHHAVDAFVVACTTRKLLQQISSNAGFGHSSTRLYADLPLPYSGFDRQEYKSKIQAIVVSHKPDHGLVKDKSWELSQNTPGQLHEETAYGVIGPDHDDPSMFWITQKIAPLSLVKKNKDKTIVEIQCIVDPDIRNGLVSAVGKAEDDEKVLSRTISEFCNSQNIKRVKIKFQKPKKTLAFFHDQNGKLYKACPTGGNFCAEIFEYHENEKLKIGVEILTVFSAVKGGRQVWKKMFINPMLRHRVFANDNIAYHENGTEVVSRVKKMEQSSGGRLTLVPSEIAGDDKLQMSEAWVASADLLFNKKNGRKISVDILGRVRDPLGIIPFL